jgi:GNAT superfamily N-acetyltransferase
VSFARQEATVRVGVTVTFLRMDAQPQDKTRPLPKNVEVRRDRWCTVEQYRTLYNTVGRQYCWWLRRMVPDHALAAMLRDARVSIHVLYLDDEPAGFYELDRTPWPAVNLSYFGLMPQAIGQGIGFAFLRHAVDTAWAMGPRAVTVNTCTADHPRALPTYVRAGFKPIRQVREEWNVPLRLGLDIPDALKI